jgi:RNA polymerase sigma-54 factor
LRNGTFLRHSQKQILAPIIQQNLHILLLSTTDLIEEINKRIEENPFLEIESDIDNRKAAENMNKVKNIMQKNESLDNLVIKDFYEDTNDFFFDKRVYEDSTADTKQAFLTNSIYDKETLYENLKKQLSILDLDNEEKKIADIIISSLDNHGLLNTTTEEIAKYVDTSVARVESVLKKIQNLDPPGIASRSINEYILNQIERKFSKDSDEYKIGYEYFKVFSEYEKNISKKTENNEKDEENIAETIKKKTIEEISKKTGYPKTYILKCLKKIEENIDPLPTIGDEEGGIYIIPDIIVSANKADMTLEVKVFDEYLPKIKVNSEYKEALKKKRGIEINNEIKELKEKYQEAKIFINSLKRRTSTLYELASKLVEIQKEFFFYGPAYIKPLTVKEMAQMLKVNDSTVSRIINNKYIATPFGIYPLKYLFSHKIDSENGEVSAKKVYEMIKKIIESEGNNSKLSDAKIEKILNSNGIKISRRTVAKYRQKLNIKSSFERKS